MNRGGLEFRGDLQPGFAKGGSQFVTPPWQGGIGLEICAPLPGGNPPYSITTGGVPPLSLGGVPTWQGGRIFPDTAHWRPTPYTLPNPPCSIYNPP